MRGLNGRTIYSERFKVRRGVVQGDIISPVFFVLAMEQIFRLHDNEGDGITMGNHLNIGVLGYADDAALMSASTEVMSKRVTEVSVGSKVDDHQQEKDKDSSSRKAGGGHGVDNGGDAENGSRVQAPLQILPATI